MLKMQESIVFMKKMIILLTVIMTASLTSCSSDNGHNINIGMDETRAEGSDTEATASQTVLTETTTKPVESLTTDTEKEPVPAETYIYIEEADLSAEYSEDDLNDFPMSNPGEDNVILYETRWKDYTVQFTANKVHRREDAFSENSLFLDDPQWRILDSEGNVCGEDSFKGNVRHAVSGGHFAYEIDSAHIEDYLRIYPMTRNGQEYPLIATLIGVLSEGNYDVTFNTITPDGGAMWFLDSLSDEIGQLVADPAIGMQSASTVGMILSGDFSYDGEGCTLTDNELGVRFTFDFENYAIAAELI